MAIADPHMLRERAGQLGLAVEVVEFTPGAEPAPQPPGTLGVLPVSLAAPCTAGKLDSANAAYVLATLDRAVFGCQQGQFQAIAQGHVEGIQYRGPESIGIHAIGHPDRGQNR